MVKNTETAAQEAAKASPGDELVEVMLFKDSNRYKGDVFVAVNGVGCQVKRGVPVKIKRKYANVLKQSMVADNVTELLKEGFSSDFSEKAKGLGV